MEAEPTPATWLSGERTPWARLPAEVQRLVLSLTGPPQGPVRDAPGGMATGVAAVVRGTERAVFVKAIDALDNPVGADLYRGEAALGARLAGLPHCPVLLAHHDGVGPCREWVALAYEAGVGPAVGHPWRAATLDRVLGAWAETRAVLQHLQLQAPAAGVGAFLSRGLALAERPDDPWHELAVAWAPRLAAVAAAADDETGAVLGHTDLRADNILYDEASGGVQFVDWAQLGTTAGWADLALLLTDVVASGADRPDGGDIDVLGLWARHPLTCGDDVELLVGLVAAMGLAMHVGATRPPAPGLPHQRSWERAVAEALLPFLHRHR